MKEALIKAAIKAGATLLHQWAAGVDERRSAARAHSIRPVKWGGPMQACLTLAAVGAIFAVLSLRRR
jgi:hypothetical protein